MAAFRQIYALAGWWNEHWGRLKVLSFVCVVLGGFGVVAGGVLVHRYGALGVVAFAVGGFFILGGVMGLVGEASARRKSMASQPDLSVRPIGTSEVDFLAARPAAQEAAQVTLNDLVIEEGMRIVESKRHPPSLGRLVAVQHHAKRASELIAEGENVKAAFDVYWRDAVRSGFPMVSTQQIDVVKAWNVKVVSLADECLSVEEATEVMTFPKLVPQFSGNTIKDLFKNNLAFLRRIEARV